FEGPPMLQPVPREVPLTLQLSRSELDFLDQLAEHELVRGDALAVPENPREKLVVEWLGRPLEALAHVGHRGRLHRADQLTRDDGGPARPPRVPCPHVVDRRPNAP